MHTQSSGIAPFFGNGLNYGADFDAYMRLRKAMTAGDVQGTASAGLTGLGFGPIVPEDLDNEVRDALQREEDMKILRRIKKVSLMSNLRQYVNRRKKTQTAFYPLGATTSQESGSAPQQPTEYERYVKAAQVYALGLGVSETSTRINFINGSALRSEIESKLLDLLNQISLDLSNGDSSVIPERFNGLITQALTIGKNPNGGNGYNSVSEFWNSPFLVDLRGAPITEQVVQTAAGRLASLGFGRADTLAFSGQAMAAWLNTYSSMKLFSPNSPQVSNGEVGQAAGRIYTGFGFDIEPISEYTFDMWGAAADGTYNPVDQTFGNAVALPGLTGPAPVTPAPLPVTVVPPPVATSLWHSADAGDYYYGVRSVSASGYSPIRILNPTAPATTVAGCAVDLVFSFGFGGPLATGFVVYRSEKNRPLAATRWFPIFCVSNSFESPNALMGMGSWGTWSTGFDGAAPNTVRDNNRFLTNTTRGYMTSMVQGNPNVEYGELVKPEFIPFAQTGLVKPGAVWTQATPILYIPQKFIIFVNVGGAF